MKFLKLTYTFLGIQQTSTRFWGFDRRSSQQAKHPRRYRWSSKKIIVEKGLGPLIDNQEGKQDLSGIINSISNITITSDQFNLISQLLKNTQDTGRMETVLDPSNNNSDPHGIQSTIATTIGNPKTNINRY